MSGQSSIRDRAATALRDAMKARDVEAVAALRTLIAAMGNAEATPSRARAGALEEAPSVGATEGERRALSEQDLIAVAMREHDEMVSAEHGAEARGMAQDVDRWRRRQEVLARLLGHPGDDCRGR